MNLYDLKKTRVDKIGRDSQKTGQFDHYATGTSDAHDSAFDTLERALGDADFLTLTKSGSDFLEIESTIGHDLADPDEIGHSLV